MPPNLGYTTAQMIADRALGMSLSEIGKKAGMTREGVRRRLLTAKKDGWEFDEPDHLGEAKKRGEERRARLEAEAVGRSEAKLAEVQAYVGKQYGTLTVLGVDKTAYTNAYALCQCECGVETRPRLHNLAQGHTNSCGSQKHHRLGWRYRPPQTVVEIPIGYWEEEG